MASYIHCPAHPNADNLGMVEAGDYWLWKYQNEPDNQMQDRHGNRISFNFTSDTMPETRHMIDGKYYTSKKVFRDVTKAHGCIEVGNETKFIERKLLAAEAKKRAKPTDAERGERREAIRQSIKQLSNRT